VVATVTDDMWFELNRTRSEKRLKEITGAIHAREEEDGDFRVRTQSVFRRLALRSCDGQVE